MQALCEDTSRTLTDKIFNQWKDAGYTNKPYALTWIEVNQLIKHFLQACRDKAADYQDYDITTILDHNLNYYENLAEIDNTVGQTSKDSEKEDYAKWMNEAEQEQAIVKDLEEQNKKLEARNKKIETMLRQAKEAVTKPQPVKEPEQQPINIERAEYAVITLAAIECTTTYQTQNLPEPEQPKPQPQTSHNLENLKTAATILKLVGWHITHL